MPRQRLRSIKQKQDSITIGLEGDATDRHIDNAISFLQDRLKATNKVVVIDLSSIRFIDGRFFGLLLMLRKQLNRQGAKLTFVCAAPAIRRMFRLNELDFLLGGEQSYTATS